MAPVRIVAIVLFGGLLAGLPSIPAAADCRCVFAGRYYEAGTYACIRTPKGPRLARCGKVSNLSSWLFTKRRCRLVSMRAMPVRALLALVPAPPD